MPYVAFFFLKRKMTVFIDNFAFPFYNGVNLTVLRGGKNMDYLKHLLKREKATLDTFKTMSKIFEMLCNQQEIKNIGKEAMTLVKELKGDVLLLQYSDDKFNVIHTLGNKETLEEKVEDKVFFKKIKESKKPFFKAEEGECFMALPILSKDVFLGVFCIYEEQKITCWEEIYTLLNLMALIFKHYELVEENKLNNIKDHVTDLFNYRHFQDQLELEVEKATRYHIPLSMVMIDVENFRLINEKLGYEAGDEVLRDIANVLEKTTRVVDMPARLNGDNFAILLSNTDLLGSYILLNRILLKLDRYKFKVNGNEFKVRVKLSATSFNAQESNGQAFLESAKEGLKGWTLPEVSDIIEKLENEKRNK